MKALFILQYPGYLRYFDSVMEELAIRGHTVAVAFDQPHKQPEGMVALEGIPASIEVLDRVPARPDVWAPVARGVRGTIDYARYLHPRYADSPYLRDRMKKALPFLTRWLGRWTTGTEAWTSRLVRWLQHCERVIPSHRQLERFLERAAPDLVVVSPLVTDQCPQVDIIKAARRIGVPSVLGVASWDHLTTKGLMRIQPDLVAVWNPDQRDEALTFHDADPARIVVTGSQCFDRWFDRSPSRDRAAFCARVGVRLDRPFIVFVGSTASISSPEAEVVFVRRWIAAVKQGPGSLADVGILIRPHPYNAKHWGDVDLSGYQNVTVFPRHGANPVNDDDRADYYDTLHHGAAGVGINTSAMIEAGIQDRPVFTIVDSSFDDTQTGTLHFRYLLPECGGHLQHATDLATHAAQLSATIDDGVAPSSCGFIERFVRPHGLEEPATPRLVSALEALEGTTSVAPETAGLWLQPLRLGLWCVAVVASRKKLKKRFSRFGYDMAARVRARLGLRRRTVEAPTPPEPPAVT